MNIYYEIYSQKEKKFQRNEIMRNDLIKKNYLEEAAEIYIFMNYIFGLDAISKFF